MVFPLEEERDEGTCMEAFGKCQSMTVVLEEGGHELGSWRTDFSSRHVKEASGIHQGFVAALQKGSVQQKWLEWCLMVAKLIRGKGNGAEGRKDRAGRPHC